MNKYKIIKVLSSKENTKVYLIEHKRLKVMRMMKQIFKKSIYFKEFSNEVFLMKDLKHTGIPQIYDIEEDDEALYVIEQYIDGESLQLLCSRAVLKEMDILNYMIQLCEIIHYLHSLDRPLLYLDLKPDNVMLSKGRVFLVDFGSAVYADLSDKSVIFGTKGFAAPEQFNHKQKIDERTDIYAVGRLMYHMVAAIDFESAKDGHEHKKEINPSINISKEMKNIMKCCVHNTSWMRYATIGEVKRNMERIYNKPKYNNVKKSIIAIAGSQRRIGTTHLALMLCQGILRLSSEVLYLENNTTGFLREYLHYSGIILQPGINRLKNNHLRGLRAGGLQTGEIHTGIKNSDTLLLSVSDDDMNKYNCIIWDFGMLNEMNIDEFLKMENKVVVLGGKAWELENSKRAITLCQNMENICYVFNFLGAGSFSKAAGMLVKSRCLRMPYVPEPFKENKEEAVAAFMNDIFTRFNICMTKKKNILHSMFRHKN